MARMMIDRAALILLVAFAPTMADEPRPAITVRLDNPDGQARALIDLFQNSKAANPAAALAAWKRASAEPNRLGKPIEALIASINPLMVEELRTIDDAEIALWFDPSDGQLIWGAFLPRDDGTFGALGTSLVLSGGAAEEPLGGLAVDRLGPPGSALMVKGHRALLLAGSRDGLKGALARSNLRHDWLIDDRFQFSLDPRALEGSKSLAIRRLKAALGESGGSISGSAGMDHSSFLASIDFAGKKPTAEPVVDPGWLIWVPTDRAMATFAVAIDPNAENWDAIFRIADRVERVDPLRENVAPLRLRLDLLARTLGVRTDADILPHLKGVSGWFGSDRKSIESAFLMLHLDDEDAARRTFDRVKPRSNSGPAPEARPGQGRRLGQVDGRPVRLFRFGPSIVLTWGDGVMEAASNARDHPERSARRSLQDAWGGTRPTFVGAAWLARLPGLIEEDSPLGRALNDAPPITASGAWKSSTVFHVEVIWKNLDATVKRFLDLIPLAPPPDR